MKKLFTICLILLFCASAYGVPIGAKDNRVTIGAFTGPRTGAEQDDNIKAATDLLNAKAAAILGSAGSIFYVDSGVAGSAGTSWGTAVGTIELANALCSDAAGDLILVSPYHAETGSTAGLDLDKDSVTVWGLGVGAAMPTFSYDTTTDTIIIGADGDNVTVHGIKFIATVTAVASAIVVEAGCTDFVIEDCVFENETSTTDEFIDTIYVTGTASDRGIIRRNRFLGDIGANAGPKASINFIDCDYLQIYENEFSGDIGDAHIFNETTASNFITIRDNRILCGYIGDAATVLDTTPGISLVATTTGWIEDNTIVTNVASEQDAIVAADCYVFGNRYRELQGNTLEVGKVYVLVKETIVTGNTDDMFLVAGGPIEIISMFGQVTTDIAGTPGNVSIELDSATDAQDADFSIIVALADGSIGDVVTFGAITASENAGILTANEVASFPLSWFATPGMIEQTLSGTGSSGAVTWYMTFRPLVEGVTVTVQ